MVESVAVSLPSKLQTLTKSVRSIAWQDALWSVAVVVGAIVVGRIIAAMMMRALARWARQTDSIVDDAIAEHLTRPIRWLLPLILLRFCMGLVVLSASTLDWINRALSIGIILGAGWFAFKTVRVVESVVTHRFDVASEDNLQARAVFTQMRGFRNIVGFVISVVTLGFVLMSFGAVRQLGAGLLASAGVAGIVLGFAAQRSISTVVAGVQIALSQPIRVDDVVIVEGEWGRIEEITLTYVVVRIWDLRRLIVPISYFIEKPFENWTRTSAELLGTVDLHLDYSVPVDAIRKEFERVLAESPDWDKKVSGVQVTDASEQTMVVRPLMSAKDSGAMWNLRCEVREKMIAFVQRNYPDALPRFRAELGDKRSRAAAA